MSDITGIPEPRYQYCDGGRAAAGFPPLTDAVRGDCATRGIAIAARLEYGQARQLLDRVGYAAQDWSEDPITYTDADDGLQIAVARRVLEGELGWEYHDLYTQPTFELDRLPMGSVVVMLASQPHLCAVVDRSSTTPTTPPKAGRPPCLATGRRRQDNEVEVQPRGSLPLPGESSV